MNTVDVGVTMSTLDDGTIEYRNAAGKKHRVDGPAVVFPDGEQRWYLNDNLHRPDGPAIVRPCGKNEWYFSGQLHRENGPAVVWADGEQWWFFNGKLHRDDGPAIIRSDGTLEWLLHGNRHRTDGPAVISPGGWFEWHLSGVILVAVTSRSEDFFLGDLFLSNLLNTEIVNELMSNKGFETKEEFGTWLALDVLGDDSIQVFTNNSFNRISMVPAVEEYLRNHEKYAGLPFSWWYPIISSK